MGSDRGFIYTIFGLGAGYMGSSPRPIHEDHCGETTTVLASSSDGKGEDIAP
jgi:hypothetical protein